jgi:YceI-like domain
VKGHFEEYQGRLGLSADPAIELTVDAASIQTGNRKRDQNLRSADFFAVEHHPRVQFESDLVELRGDTMRVRGRLAARGHPSRTRRADSPSKRRARDRSEHRCAAPRARDRQKMILEGWRDAIWAGRYAAVRYDCASQSVAHWIARLAKKVGLAGSKFTAVVQTTAQEIATLSPAADDDPSTNEPRPQPETAPPPEDPALIAPPRALPVPTPAATERLQPPTPPQVEPMGDAAQHPLYQEVFGTEPKPRRRWRR